MRTAGRFHLLTLVLIIVIGLALLAGPLTRVAHSQEGGDPTATATPPDTGRIFFTRASVVFPAALQFLVGIGSPPADVVGATLTVHQDGRLLREFADIPIEPNVFDSSDDATELLFTWRLDERPLPTPFDTLRYTWTVETADGEISTAENALEYIDTRFPYWQTAGAAPVMLHWHNPTLNADRMLPELEQVYDAIMRYAPEGAPGAPLFEFAIYDAAAPLCPTVEDPETGERMPGVVAALDERVFACTAAQHAAVYAGGGLRMVQRTSSGYTDLRDQLAVAIVEGTLARWWGDAVDAPAWFGAGVAALLRPQADLAALERVRAAARADRLYALADLAEPPPDDAPYSDRALWQAQSYLLALYLADQAGAEAPFRLAAALPAEDVPFAEALRDRLDVPDLASLWDRWTRWLFTDAATRAAGWTPYTATTPTPAATLSPATAAPRPTPTRTPTAAPSLTPTTLGDQAPPVVRMAVSPTRELRASNTPRPPGSLPSVTPRPAAALAAPDDDAGGLDRSTALGVLALAAGGALLLIVLGALVIRRR